MITGSDHTWYYTGDLDLDGVLVMFLLQTGGQGPGIKKWVRRGKRVVYRLWVGPNRYEDIPRWAEPDLWRPIRPENWPHPLPDLSAVVQHAPEPVKPVASPRVPVPVIDVAIRHYSPPGEISRAEAEIRMIRFIRTDRVQPWANPSGLVSGWNVGQISEWAKSLEEEKKDATRDPTPRWEPTPRDITDSETVLKWFMALNPPGLGRERINDLQEVIIWRAMEPTPSWPEIGELVGSSDAADLYRRAMNAVHRAANGQPAFPHLNLPDPIAELRRRNRLYRERASA